jgi:hypothetical protein
MFNLTLPTPVELAFEPINLCNARCFCCPYTFLEKDKEYRGRRMSPQQIEELITQFAEGVKKYNVPKMKASVQPWRYSDPLVCRDLDMIFELCQQHDLSVVLTTNAVSFNESKCDLMMKYIDNIGRINISIIGYNQEEIREWMDLDWNVTQARLAMVRDKYPLISKKMNIGVKHKDQNPAPQHYRPVIENIKKLTLGKVKKKTNWLENRLVYNKFDDDGLEFQISKDRFVKGCDMVHGKILRRLEVMVDGTAVLCCDDATAQTNFGNVFEIGVDGVWQKLKDYHSLVYSTEYDGRKKNMICNTCSRARFEWDEKKNKGIVKANKEYITWPKILE